MAFWNKVTPKKALDCYEKALKLKPDYASALNNKGNALHKLSKSPEALKYYDEAIRLEPDCAIYYHNKGNTLNDMGRELEAIEFSNKALKLKPDFPHAYIAKSSAFIKLKKYLEALECANEAVKLKPDLGEAHFMKGNALFGLERLPEAVECYNEAVKLKPDTSRAYYMKAVILDSFGKKLEAIECFDEAVKYNPNDLDAHYYKGTILTDLSRHEEAMSCYDKVIMLKRDHIDAWNRKLFSLRQLGRRMDAINLAITMTLQGLGNPLLEEQRREEMANFNRCYNTAIVAQANRLINNMQRGTNRENIVNVSETINQDHDQLQQAFIGLKKSAAKFKDEFEKLKAAAETNQEYQEEVNEKSEAVEKRCSKISQKVNNILCQENNESNEEGRQEIQQLIEDIEKFKKRTEKKISHLKSSMGIVEEQNTSEVETGSNEIKNIPEIEIGPSKMRKYCGALHERLFSALKEAEIISSDENYDSNSQNSNHKALSQAIELAPILANVLKSVYSFEADIPNINNIKKHAIKLINTLGLNPSARESVIKQTVETAALNNRDKINAIEDDPEIEYWLNYGIAAKCRSFFTIKEVNTFYQNKPEILGCIDAMKIIYAIECDKVPRDLLPDETIKQLALVPGSYKFSKAKSASSNSSKNACCTTF
ncbi:unnamed protein product [Blepharisma stoltei]|uniref:Uncharacterized protein n=1 Tax=Blepharisma stoltei TaxID=1481888 RepID=A0AAU9KC55_9CILI|nr:unnamed protein product [Blepharisma stoltei]